MMNWYVYHSAETMDRRYGNPEPNRVFSTAAQRKLCIGDTIWVIEGVGKGQKSYSLAARFVCSDQDFSPFPSEYRLGLRPDFKAMYSGPGESFGDRFVLDDAAHPWFEKLRSKYITKRKFFNRLDDLPEVLEGLRSLVA